MHKSTEKPKSIMGLELQFKLRPGRTLPQTKMKPKSSGVNAVTSVGCFIVIPFTSVDVAVAVAVAVASSSPSPVPLLVWVLNCAEHPFVCTYRLRGYCATFLIP